MDKSFIKVIQRCLNYLLPSIQVEDNGHYGHFSEKLVKEFQINNNIEGNGIFDEETWEKMKAVLTGSTKLIPDNIEPKIDLIHYRQQEIERLKQKKVETQNKESSAALTKLEEKLKTDFTIFN